MVINNIGKWLYHVYMYKPLFVNVSVSLIVSGVQPHMTIPISHRPDQDRSPMCYDAKLKGSRQIKGIKSDQT